MRSEDIKRDVENELRALSPFIDASEIAAEPFRPAFLTQTREARRAAC